MKQKFIYALKLLKKAFFSLFLIEIIYRFVANIIILPFCKLLFNLSLKITGLNYLSTTNFSAYIKNPINDIVAIIVLIILTLYTILEMSLIIMILNQVDNNKELDIIDLIKQSSKKITRVLKPKNWSLIILILILTPFAQFGKFSTLVTEIKIPWFIVQVTNSFPWNWITVILTVFLILYIFPRLLSIFYFIINGCDAKEATKRSLNLLLRNRDTDLEGFILFYIIVVVISGIASIGIDYLAGFFIEKIFSGYTENYLLVAVHNTNKYIVNFLLSGIGVFANYAYLFVLKSTKETKNTTNLVMTKEPDAHINNRFAFLVLFVGIFIVSVVMNIRYTYIVKNNIDDKNLYVSNTVSVVAHRGDSIDAPENTIPAFEKAIDLNVDYIELDVEETKDGVVVVTHDHNLKRRTGYDAYIWDLTYDEVEQLDASKGYKNYSDVKIPTLDEVLKLSKGKVKVLIELKMNNHDEDIASKVVDIIKDNDMIDNVIVQSTSYNQLTKVKNIDSNIKCCYIMTIAAGNYEELKDADSFAIETSYISKSSVNKAHKLGKQVFAWTVDQNSDMEKVLEAGVDGIITNKITDVKNKIIETDNIFVATYKAFLN